MRTRFFEFASESREGNFHDFKRDFARVAGSQDTDWATLVRDVAHLHNAVGQAPLGVAFPRERCAYLVFGVHNRPELGKNELSGMESDAPDDAEIVDRLRKNLVPPVLAQYFALRLPFGTGRFGLLEIAIGQAPVSLKVGGLFDERFCGKRLTRCGSQNITCGPESDNIWQRVVAQFPSPENDAAASQVIRDELARCHANRDPHTLKVLLCDEHVSRRWQEQDGTCAASPLSRIRWNAVINLDVEGDFSRSLLPAVETLAGGLSVVGIDEAPLKKGRLSKAEVDASQRGDRCIVVNVRREINAMRVATLVKTFLSDVFASGGELRPVVLVLLLASEIDLTAKEDSRQGLVRGVDKWVESLDDSQLNCVSILALAPMRNYLIPIETVLAGKSCSKACFALRVQSMITPLVEGLADLPPGDCVIAGEVMLDARFLAQHRDLEFLAKRTVQKALGEDAAIELCKRFLRGSDLSVAELAQIAETSYNLLIVRSYMGDMLRRLRGELERIRANRVSLVVDAVLGHFPTSGGTVCAKWLCLQLRDSYPALILKRLPRDLSDLSSALTTVAKKCALPLFVVLEADHFDSRVQLLLRLREAGAACVVLSLQRLTLEEEARSFSQDPSGFKWRVPAALTPEELVRMRQSASAFQIKGGTEAKLFFWGFSTFAAEYERIESHVQALTRRLALEELLLFILAALLVQHTEDASIRLPLAALMLGLDPGADWRSTPQKLIRFLLTELLVCSNEFVRFPVSNKQAAECALRAALRQGSREDEIQAVLSWLRKALAIRSDAFFFQDAQKITRGLLVTRNANAKFSSFVHSLPKELARKLFQEAAELERANGAAGHLGAHFARFLLEIGDIRGAREQVLRVSEAQNQLSKGDPILLTACGDVLRRVASSLLESESAESRSMAEVQPLLSGSLVCYERGLTLADQNYNPFALLGKAKLLTLLLRHDLVKAEGIAGLEAPRTATDAVRQVRDLAHMACRAQRATKETDTEATDVLRELFRVLVSNNKRSPQELIRNALAERDLVFLSLAGEIREGRSWAQIRRDELELLVCALEARVYAEKGPSLYHSDFSDLLMAHVHIAHLKDEKKAPAALRDAIDLSETWMIEVRGSPEPLVWATALLLARWLHSPKLSSTGESLLSKVTSLDDHRRRNIERLPDLSIAVGRGGTLASVYPNEIRCEERLEGRVTEDGAHVELDSEALSGRRIEIRGGATPSGSRCSFILCVSAREGLHAQDLRMSAPQHPQQ